MKTAWTAVGVPDGARERDTGDPLGIRAWGNRVARRLVPGLTRVSRSTRGFSLLCFCLSESKKYRGHEREAFLRAERLWVGAYVAGGGGTDLAGVRAAGRLLSDDGYPLDRPILSDQLAGGVWGQYRRAAVSFGMVSGAGLGRLTMGTTRVRAPGRDMAACLRREMHGTHLARFLTSQGTHLVPRHTLDKITATSPLAEAEVGALSEGMREFDKARDGALGRLRAIYETDGLDVDSVAMSPDRLSDLQAAAAVSAVAVRDLVDLVEVPYRRWITNLGRNPVSIDVPGVIWDLAGREHESDVARLGRAIAEARLGARMDAVHDFHRTLAQERGSDPWEPGHSPGEGSPPTFALDAAAQLFGEGVLG